MGELNVQMQRELVVTLRPVNEERLSSTLSFIRAYQVKNGRSPTYREIQKECGYSSLGSVSADVARLKDRNLIEAECGNGWKTIKTPENIRTERSHNAMIVGTVRCGQPNLAVEDIEASVALPDVIFGTADHVLLHAKGPSMIRRGIFDGDLLVVRRKETAQPGEIVIAMLENGETTCKVLARKGGKPYLKAANDELDENGNRKYDVFPRGEWSIYGVVDYVIHAPLKNDL